MYQLFQKILTSGLANANEDAVKADVWAIVHKWGFEKFNSHWYKHNHKALEAKGQPVPNWQEMRYAAELLTALKELQMQQTQGLREQKLQEIAHIQAQVYAIDEAAHYRESEIDELIRTLKPPAPQPKAEKRQAPPPTAPVVREARHVQFQRPAAAAASRAITTSHPKAAKRRKSEVEKLQTTYFRS